MHNNLGMRTKKMHEKYKRYQRTHFKDGACTLCDKKKAKSLKEFKNWRIVENIFPWDRIAKLQHMILPKRHVVSPKLNKSERDELEKIKMNYINKRYVIIAEATNRAKSIPEHFHLHLIVTK